MLLCLPFTDGTFKGHFGKVHLEYPPLSVVVKLLSLQHVREVVCLGIQECEVSISVRCNDDSCLASLDSVRTYFTIPTLYYIFMKVLYKKWPPLAPSLSQYRALFTDITSTRRCETPVLEKRSCASPRKRIPMIGKL